MTGKQKLYAPDPDPSLPVYKITPGMEPLNPSSDAKQLSDNLSYITSQQQDQHMPTASALIHFANPIPQQQLPDTYAIPLSSQPQLQQHLMQQQSLLQGVPVSVYNPTYLVTQSNQLLNQHRERLFKPAPAFLGTINQPTIDMSASETHPFRDVTDVASPGQILIAKQKENSEIINEFKSVSASLQAESHSNSPSFERFSAPSPEDSNIIFGQRSETPQQPLLTQQEISNLLNFGSLNTGLVNSYYNQEHSDAGIDADMKKRQQLNEQTISQANEEMRKKKFEYSTSQPTTIVYPINSQPQNIISTSQPISAHKKHQQMMADQFSNNNNKSPLLIYVPDEDTSKVNGNFQ